MSLVLSIVLAVLALEAAKILWHGRLEGALWLVAAHAAAAAYLAVQAIDGVHGTAGPPPWQLQTIAAVLAITTVSCSRAALQLKRDGHWLGEWLSGLSSYPWELAACAALWPALGRWTVPAAVALAWLCGLLWVSPLRPPHWGPSPKEWLYPKAWRGEVWR